MTRISRRLGAVVGGVLVVVMVPSAAWAPKVFHRTRINGTCTASFGAGTFGGELELSHFSASGDDLSVSGIVSGICTKVGDSDTWVPVASHAIGFPVVAPEVSCEEFKFTASGSFNLSGTTVDIAPVSPAIQTDKDLAGRLCGVDRFYDAGRIDQVAHLLNSMI